MNAATYVAEELLKDAYDPDSVTFKIIHGHVKACDLARALEDT